MEKNLTKDFFGHRCVCKSKTAFETHGDFNGKPAVIRYCCDCDRRYFLDENGKPMNEVKEFQKNEDIEYFKYRTDNNPSTNILIYKQDKKGVYLIRKDKKSWERSGSFKQIEEGRDSKGNIFAKVTLEEAAQIVPDSFPDFKAKVD